MPTPTFNGNYDFFLVNYCSDDFFENVDLVGV